MKTTAELPALASASGDDFALQLLGHADG